MYSDTELRTRDNEGQFHHLAAVVPHAVLVVDPTGKIVYTNPRWREYFGERGALVQEGDWTPVLHPTEVEYINRVWNEAVQRGEPFQIDCRLLRADGAYRWQQVNCVPVHDTSGAVANWYGVHTDIHDRKEAQENQRLLLLIGEKIRQAEDADQVMYDVAAAIGEHLGARRCFFNETDLTHDRETIRRDYCHGVPSLAGVHRVSDYSEATSAEMKRGHTVVNRDAQADPRTAMLYDGVYAPNGERAYVAVPLMRDGQWVATLRVSDDQPRDWTEQEVALLESTAERTWLAVEKLRNEYALRESEERFRAIVNQAGTGIVQCDLDGRFLFVNDGFAEIVGYTRLELLGKRLQDITHIADIGDSGRLIEQLVAFGGPFEIEKAFRRRDGSMVWGGMNLTVVRDATGNATSVMAVVIDITERKRAESNQRFLIELDRDLAGLPDASDMAILALGRVAQHLDVTGCYLSEVDLAAGVTHVDHEWSRRGYSMKGTYSIAEFVPANMMSRLEAGDNIATDDVRTDPLTSALADSYARIDVGAVVSAPHLSAGKLVAILSADTSAPRQWLSDEVQLLREVVNRLWPAIERARATAALRESEKRFQIVSRATNDAIWDWDLTTDSAWWNAGVQTLFGYAPNEVSSTAAWWYDHLHPDERERVISSIHAVIDSREAIWREEYRFQRADGSFADILDRGYVIRDDSGTAVRMLGAMQDLTARKQAEAALRNADRRKDEFLATLAHELRNPLAPIRNSLELLKRAGSDQVLFSHARSTMERQIQHMVRLVDDLLDVSRISQDKLELRKERVELRTVVDRAVEACRPFLDQANHALHVSLPGQPTFLQADAVRLAQVLGNLLSNAAKYTPAGGDIWLSVERHGSEVHVTVKDTGIGIPREMLGSVFDLFTQVDRSLERTTGGLGIGLSLVKRLVEMHAGTVIARSEGEGHGSEFEVRLPMLMEEKPAGPSSETPDLATPIPSHRALIVDDNIDGATSLGMLLRLSGTETETAHDGEEALHKADVFRPDVILLDIGLPKINGYDVCRAIRARPWGADVTIIALTGWGQDEDRQRSADSGFDGHLVKPVAFGDLMKILAKEKREIRK